MPPLHPNPSLQPVSSLNDTDSFQVHLADQIRRAPWIALSIALHAVALFFVWDREFSSRAQKPDTSLAIVVSMEESIVEILDVQDQEPVERFEFDPELINPKPPQPLPTPPEPGPSNPGPIGPINEFSDISPILGVGAGGSAWPGAWRGRNNGRGGGGPIDSRKAVFRGLDWLARHQNPDGSWDSDGFEAQCEGGLCAGRGQPLHDVGLTGLSLLAFLGAGFTPVHQGTEDRLGNMSGSANRYTKIVKKGVRYLMSVQDVEGCIGTRIQGTFVYDHALAALALVESYGMTGFSMLRTPAQRAVEFVEAARNPFGGWRYGVRSGESDSSVSGWMVMVLKSALVSGLTVDRAALDGARGFFDRVTDGAGRTGYTRRGTGPMRPAGEEEKFPASYSESLTAVGMISKIFLGEDPTRSSSIQSGARLLLAALPSWERPKIDMYYWYYGTLAMYQVGGNAWKRWHASLKPTILDHQALRGCEGGSWDPVGAWGAEGGRIYSTALMTLCLESYYRYNRLFGAKVEFRR